MDPRDPRAELRALTEVLRRLPQGASRRHRADRELARAFRLPLSHSRLRLAQLVARLRRAIAALDDPERATTNFEGAHRA